MFIKLALAWYRLEYWWVKNSYTTLENVKNNDRISSKTRLKAAVMMAERIDRKRFLENKLGIAHTP